MGQPSPKILAREDKATTTTTTITTRAPSSKELNHDNKLNNHLPPSSISGWRKMIPAREMVSMEEVVDGVIVQLAATIRVVVDSSDPPTAIHRCGHPPYCCPKRPSL